MSKSNRNALYPALAIIIVGVYFLTVNWFSKPASSTAIPGGPSTEIQWLDVIAIDPEGTGGNDIPPGGGGTLPAPPSTSVIFVIDSSENMYPRFGPDYFELAKQGIVNFLSHDSIPLDFTLEVGILQFTRVGAPRYTDLSQYVYTRQLDASIRNGMILAIERLERSTHFSASLLEMGIREAKWFLDTHSRGDANTQNHIILLTPGEYRLPRHYQNVNGLVTIVPGNCPPWDYSFKPSDISTDGKPHCPNNPATDAAGVLINYECEDYGGELAQAAKPSGISSVTLLFNPQLESSFRKPSRSGAIG